MLMQKTSVGVRPEYQDQQAHGLKTQCAFFVPEKRTKRWYITAYGRLAKGWRSLVSRLNTLKSVCRHFRLRPKAAVLSPKHRELLMNDHYRAFAYFDTETNRQLNQAITEHRIAEQNDLPATKAFAASQIAYLKRQRQALNAQEARQ